MAVKVKNVKLADITVKQRARKDIGDLTSIKFSIEKYGVLNPILLDEELRLIAGERRLLACKELEHKTIPSRIITGVSAEDHLLIERIENVDRKDFQWAEEIELKFQIHEFYQARDEEWSYRKTCEVLGVSIGGLSSDLELALAIRTFPELAGAKTKRKAYEVYKKLIQRADAIRALEELPDEERTKLEKMLNGESEEEPIEQSTPTEVTNSDSQDQVLEIVEYDDVVEPAAASVTGKKAVKFIYQVCSWEKLLESIPDGTIGFAELDPPYAIDYESLYSDNIHQNDPDWTVEQLEDNMNRLLSMLYKKLLPDAWVLCWTGYEHAARLNRIAKAANYAIQHPGFWIKPGGSGNRLDRVRILNYETNLLFRKGSATFNNGSLLAALNFSGVHASQKYHQWQKPLDQYQYFFDSLGRPRSIFFSPFAGSGMSLVAAALNDMIPVGCDISRKYFYQFYKTLKEYTDAQQASTADLQA